MKKESKKEKGKEKSGEKREMRRSDREETKGGKGMDYMSKKKK